MQVKQIEMFITVAKEKSFTKAAEKLFVSQPNISKMISSLEKELGFKLFVRSTKQIELTPEGEIIFNRLKRIPQMVDEALEEVHYQQTTGQKDHITIGIMKDREIHSLLDQLCQQWISESIHCDMSFEVNDFHILRRGLRTNRYDAVIIPAVEMRTMNNFEMLTITSQKIIVAMSRNLPVTKRKKISLQDLDNQPFLLLAAGDEQMEVAMRDLLESTGVPSPRFMYVDSMDSLMLNVELGTGVALLGQHSYLENHPEIRFLELKDKQIEIVLTWKSNNHKSGLKTFIQQLQGKI